MKTRELQERWTKGAFSFSKYSFTDMDIHLVQKYVFMDFDKYQSSFDISKNAHKCKYWLE